MHKNLSARKFQLGSHSPKRLRTEKEEHFISQLETLKTVLNEKLKRCVELACEKGTGAWPSALPLQLIGYISGTAGW